MVGPIVGSNVLFVGVMDGEKVSPLFVGPIVGVRVGPGDGA